MSLYSKLITLLLIGSLCLNIHFLWPKQPNVDSKLSELKNVDTLEAPPTLLFNQAKHQFEQHQFDQAILSYEQLKNSHPQQAKALYSAWISQLKTWLNKNSPHSPLLLNSLLNQYPYNVELLNLHVDYLIQSNQPQNAIIALFELYPLLSEQAQSSASECLKNLTKKELSHLREQQNWHLIVEQTQIWLDYQNENSEFLYALAHAYYQQGDFISAQATLDRMPVTHALTAQVNTLQGLLNKAQSSTDFVKLIPQGAHYLINTEINNSLIAQLMIDTGASITAISPNVIEQLSPRPVYLGDVTVNTANGQVVAQRYKVESFKVGKQVMHDFEVLSIENTRQQGLLGMNFLSQFEFNINQQTNELELNAN